MCFLIASLDGDRQTTTRCDKLYRSLGNCQRTNRVLVVLFGAVGGNACLLRLDRSPRALVLAAWFQLPNWRHPRRQVKCRNIYPPFSALSDEREVIIQRYTASKTDL